MNLKVRRKTPDELLSEIDESELETSGRLKIFLGYTSGVGKSYRMFDEARRRRERGQDVIVGATQPVVPPEVSRILPHIEVLPLKQFPGGAAIDLQAVLRRRPDVCIVDGLAYNNPPGLRNLTRWQDVVDLVRAGIKVIGSINIQYIEELREQVEPITGKHVTETVPVSFINSADEIEIVDAPTEEPLERSPAEQVSADERRERLSLLRELALVLAADVVDHQLSSYLDKHGIRQQFGAQERILVCITPRSNASEMIETARLIADSFHAEMTAVYVKQRDLSAEDETALRDRLAFAGNMGSRTEILDGEDAVDTLIDYAQAHGITQLFVGHSQRQKSLLRHDPVDTLIRRSQGMDIRIFPQ
jgi:two-component system, OmpR family, sensor histidine kinase KdpD